MTLSTSHRGYILLFDTDAYRRNLVTLVCLGVIGREDNGSITEVVYSLWILIGLLGFYIYINEVEVRLSECDIEVRFHFAVETWSACDICVCIKKEAPNAFYSA